MRIIFVLAAMLIVGCDDGCKPLSTRCNGSVVEVCNTGDRWEKEADCGEIDDFGGGNEWTCCIDPEDGEASCLIAEDCHPAAGSESN